MDICVCAAPLRDAELAAPVAELVWNSLGSYAVVNLQGL